MSRGLFKLASLPAIATLVLSATFGAPNPTSASSVEYLTQWPSATTDMAINSNDELLALEGYTVKRYDAEGAFIDGFGGEGAGDGQFANNPISIAIDSQDNVYVGENYTGRVQKFAADGTFLSELAIYGFRPFGMAVDSLGNLYLVDLLASRVVKSSASGTILATWGTAGTGEGEFDQPVRIAIDSHDNVYVVENQIGHARVQKFDSDGNFLTTWGSFGSADGQFRHPRGMDVDSYDNIYVADALNQRVQQFNSGGTFLASLGHEGSGEGEFHNPHDVAIDSSDNTYVADDLNRIQKFAGFAAPPGGCITPPQPAIDTSGGTLGSAAWYTSAPVLSSPASGVMWDTAHDGQPRSGYTTTVPTLASGTTTVYAKAVDGACESTEASATYSVDPIAPTVTCPSPSPSFALNQAGAEVTASIADVISGPGAASVSADAATSSAGAKTVSVTGFDVAGNSTTQSCNYTVAYNATQFSSPVDAGIRNVAKAGQPIPLKFRLTDANGDPVLDLTSVTVTVASLACDRGVTADNLEEYATGQSGLQNLGDGWYQYNWKTPKTYANSCKTMRLSLGEGAIVHLAEFEFRK